MHNKKGFLTKIFVLGKIYMKELKFFRLSLVLAAILLLGLLAGCGSDEESGDTVTVRVGSLKGPTSLGILFLMEKAENRKTAGEYEFRMAAGAEELLPLMVKGELDIALVPANVAAILYEKTKGGVAVVDINTLSVLYLVTGSEQVRSVGDLKGRTIYLTGKGTTPEAVLRFILHANGLGEEQNNILSESKGIITEGRGMMRIVEIREITLGRCQGYYRGLEPV